MTDQSQCGGRIQGSIGPAIRCFQVVLTGSRGLRRARILASFHWVPATPTTGQFNVPLETLLVHCVLVLVCLCIFIFHSFTLVLAVHPPGSVVLQRACQTIEGGSPGYHDTPHPPGLATPTTPRTDSRSVIDIIFPLSC